MADKPSPLSRLSASWEDAKIRRKPSGCDFAICDCIRFVNSSDWDHVTAGSSIFLKRSVLQAIESHGPEGVRFRYAIIYRDSEPIAVLATQLLTIRGDQLTAEQLTSVDEEDRKVLKTTAKKIREKTLRHLTRSVIVCGNLLSWGPHGLHVLPGADDDSTWDAIAEALYRIRRIDRLHGQTDYVLVKDLPSGGDDNVERLQRYRYRQHETEPDMVLSLGEAWTGFEDYLASLNRKYRKSAKSTFNAVQDGGLEIERLTAIADVDAGRVFDLYCEVQSRAKVRLFRISDRYLPALADALGPDAFRCTVIRNDREIVGFVTTLKDGDTAIGYFIGVDYEANATAPVYLRLLYAVIDDAIDMGCRRVSFGRTALEPKARLGCKPENTTVWIRHRVPVLNMLVQPLLQAIPHDDPPDRSPFKAEPEPTEG